MSVGVNSLTIDPASPSTLYAQTVGNGSGSAVVPSLFKTTDGGGTWKAVGSVTGVDISGSRIPANSSTIYAGTSQGVVKSTNAGASWNDASNGLPAGSVTRLVIDPITPTTLYAITSNASIAVPGGPIAMSIFKTSDSGGNWSVLNTGLPTSAFITVLAIDPSTPSTLYTFAPPFDPTGTGAPAVGGFLKSTDGGQSWQTLNSGLLSIFLSSLAIDPASSTLYATTSRGLLKSMDGGTSWTALNAGLPANTSVTFVTIDAAAPSALYAAGSTFAPTGQSWVLLKSMDGGGTWSTFNIGLPPNTAISSIWSLDPMSPAGIYVGTAGLLGPPGIFIGPSSLTGGGASGGVFKSTDGGETWNATNTGLGRL